MLFAMLGLSILGVLFIFSSSYDKPGHFELKQCVWIAAGMVVYFMTAAVGYRVFMSMSYLLYAIAILSLFLVALVVQKVYGAQRWLMLGPLVIQPSEFAKIFTLLAVVKFVGNDDPRNGQWRVIVGAVAIVLFPFLMILKQPDLGSSLLFIPMLVTVLFLWGIRIRYLVGTLVSALVMIPS